MRQIEIGHSLFHVVVIFCTVLAAISVCGQSSTKYMSTTTTTTTTQLVQSNASSSCSNTWSDEICSRIASGGLCSNQDVLDVCCGSCLNETIGHNFVMCGFNNPGLDRDQCTNLTVQYCQPINTASKNCILLPDDHFHLGETFLLVDVYSNQRLHFSLHSDPNCAFPFTTLDSVSQLTVFGECTDTYTSRGEFVGRFHFFKNCQQNRTTETWTCYGNELPCYHWTRQREDRCVLESDLSYRPDNLCSWNVKRNLCTGNWQQAVCEAIVPPLCNLSFCEFDPGSGVCALSRNACLCTSNGKSGGINVTHSGCSEDHNENVDVPICYVEGGADAHDLCTCVQPSDAFPGAGFRTCASYGGCNTLSVKDQSGTLTGYYVAVDDLNRPYGCTPYLLYRPVLIGFNPNIILRFIDKNGFSPDNFLFSSLSPYWTVSDISQSYAEGFDNARVLLTIQNAVAVKMGNDVPNPVVDLQGQWDMDFQSTPSNIRLSVTCNTRYPCLHPRWHLLQSDFTVSPLLSRLELLNSSPQLYERVHKAIYSRALVNMYFALWKTKGSTVRGFLSNLTSIVPYYSKASPRVEVTCNGFSRIDESIKYASLGFVVEQGLLVDFPSFTLHLQPYSIYLCRTNVSCSSCATNDEITAVFITPSELPDVAPSLMIQQATENCVDVHASSSSTTGIFSSFVFYLMKDEKSLAVQRSNSDKITFCNLSPATSYKIFSAIVNDVGEGPKSSILAKTLDGVPRKSVTLTSRRLTPSSISVTWPALSSFDAQGDVQIYIIYVFSSSLALGEFARVLSSVNFTRLGYDQAGFDALTESVDDLSNTNKITNSQVFDFLNVSHTFPLPDGIVQEQPRILGQFERSLLLDNLDEERVYAFSGIVINQRHAGPMSNFSYAGLYVDSTSSSFTKQNIYTITAFIVVVVMVFVVALVLYKQCFAPNQLTPLSDVILDQYYLVDETRLTGDDEFECDDHFQLVFGFINLSPKQNEHSDSNNTIDENEGVLDGLSCRSGNRDLPLRVIIKCATDATDRMLTKLLCNETVFLDHVSDSLCFVELLAVSGLNSNLKICTDYVHNSLFNCLKSNRGQNQWQMGFNEVDLFELATKASNSLVYLSQRGIVHRNIQSRSYFINVRGGVVLGDFLVAQFVDTTKNDYLISYEDTLKVISQRWMAPESMEDRIFSTESDVFSFGVVLWEIFSFGRQPWSGHKESDVAQTITRGIHLDIPMRCSHETYKIMLSCWKMTPSQRPSAFDLSHRLNARWEKLQMSQKEDVGPFITRNINSDCSWLISTQSSPCLEKCNQAISGVGTSDSTKKLVEAKNGRGESTSSIPAKGRLLRSRSHSPFPSPAAIKDYASKQLRKMLSSSSRRAQLYPNVSTHLEAQQQPLDLSIDSNTAREDEFGNTIPFPASLTEIECSKSFPEQQQPLSEVVHIQNLMQQSHMQTTSPSSSRRSSCTSIV
eukprot:m.31909 g.31909  ORF g.31909 m.31909 type:complete len:1451 (+) comp6344_c0_seq1:258-4610(+)